MEVRVMHHAVKLLRFAVTNERVLVAMVSEEDGGMAGLLS